MKRIFCLSFVFCTICLVAFSQEGDKNFHVKFNKTYHDFGTFTEKKGIQKCQFEIENTGKTPLVILKITTNCGCAVASYTFAPLKPSAKGEIEIKYDGKGKAPGTFVKSILVYTNRTTKPFKLYIKGVMKR